MEDLEWVPEVTREAMVRILAHAKKVGLANTDEFTFRAFFMAAVHDRLGTPYFQTEWRKFDLLIQQGDAAFLIEFKYYMLRRNYELDGAAGRPKGGAGLKNEAEFNACLAKLREATIPGVDERLLVLIYERDNEVPDRRVRTLHRSYGDLESSSAVARVWRLSVGPLEGRVLVPKLVAESHELPSSSEYARTAYAGAEDASGVWADESHEFDQHPQYADLCILCLQGPDFPAHDRQVDHANGTTAGHRDLAVVRPCWSCGQESAGFTPGGIGYCSQHRCDDCNSCGRPALKETSQGTPYCDGVNPRTGAACREHAIYSEMTW